MDEPVRCEHQEKTPEAVEMTLEDSLEHFMNCLSRQEQIQRWSWYREDWDLAHRCRITNHDNEIRVMQQYIMELRNRLDRYTGCEYTN